MTKINMKVTHPKYHLKLPGANELMYSGLKNSSGGTNKSITLSAIWLSAGMNISMGSHIVVK